MNNIPFTINPQAMRGDTVSVYYGDLFVCAGILHLPLSTVMPAIIFIKISDLTKDDYPIEQRRTFATFNHGDYIITRIVLTEKNIYTSLHGALSKEELWEETEGFYEPEF